MSYPRLYKATEAASSNPFSTLGFGMLSDAISCVVTEERNGEFELEMEYPIGGLHYSELEEDRLLMCKANEKGNEQIFRIYKIENLIDGVATVYAEHISYLLNKAAMLPFECSGASAAFEQIKGNVLWQASNKNFPSFPFSFWTDNGKNGHINIETPTTVRSALGGTDGSVLDACGGEYEFDNFQVKLYTNRGSDKNVYLRYGKNITDLKGSDDISGVYTGILPYWKGSLQKVSYDDDGNKQTESYDTIVYLDDKVKWSDYTGSYGYPLANVVDFSSEIDSDVADVKGTDENGNETTTYYTTEADIRKELKTLADEYVTNNKGWEPASNIEVSFVNLWDTPEYEHFAALQRVYLCDTVHIVYPILNIDVSMEVITTEYNVLLDRYDKIELGEPKSSFTSSVVNSESDTTSKIDKTASQLKSDLAQEAERATNLINGTAAGLANDIITSFGGNGGYVVINPDTTTGYPKEILIMDKPDISTATHVWRWNQYGLGHSSNGYNGPYDDVAITYDGHINANAITTGILTAITMQTATSGYRLRIEGGSSSIKGMNGSSVLNVIDMINGSDNKMVIDAQKGVYFRAPEIGVTAKSYGTGSGTVTPCRTGTSEYVTNVDKEMHGSDKHPWEGWVADGDVGDVGRAVYCTLPVYLRVQKRNDDYINGFQVTNGSVSTSWI